MEVGTTRLLSEKFLLGKNAKNTGTWKIGENWFDYNCRKTVSLKKTSEGKIQEKLAPTCLFISNYKSSLKVMP